MVDVKIAGALALWSFCLLTAAEQGRPSRPAPVPVPLPQEMPKAEPKPVEGLFDGKLRQKVLLTLVRHRAIAQMQKDGFKAVGGADKPLTRDQAEALYDKLTDDVILGAVKEASPKAVGAIGEGGFLANLLEWIRTHPEELAAIVKLILSLLALF